MDSQKSIRVAILDLYEGQANQGMRCIRELLTSYGDTHGLDLHYDEFEVRLKQQVPDLSYDIYISSGGPGSPLDSEGSAWEAVYWRWLSALETYNANPANAQPKQVLLQR
jgi:homoserine O-succinyltransferase